MSFLDKWRGRTATPPVTTNAKPRDTLGDDMVSQSESMGSHVAEYVKSIEQVQPRELTGKQQFINRR